MYLRKISSVLTNQNKFRVKKFEINRNTEFLCSEFKTGYSNYKIKRYKTVISGFVCYTQRTLFFFINKLHELNLNKFYVIYGRTRSKNLS